MTIGMMAFRTFIHILGLGTNAFPVKVERGHYVLAVLLNIGFLTWGIFAIWG
jgi:hypothetical protein